MSSNVQRNPVQTDDFKNIPSQTKQEMFRGKKSDMASHCQPQVATSVSGGIQTVRELLVLQLSKPAAGEPELHT